MFNYKLSLTVILASILAINNSILFAKTQATIEKTKTKISAVEISPRIFKPVLVLPPSLEPRRSEFEATLTNAQKRLLRVAEKYEWSYLMNEPLMTKAEIFDSKLAYDNALKKLFPEVKDTKIPGTFTAGFKDNYFFAVSPEIYKEKVPKYIEPGFYEKLITHELAHRLHMKLVNGNEDKMGPIWFWEGFATLVASQFENDKTTLTQKEILKILNEPKRGSYKQYNQVLKHFVKLVPLPELVRRASQKGLKKWLLNYANP